MTDIRPVPFWSPAEIDAAIPRAIAHVQDGGVLAYPTETVYGFGSTVEAAAVDRLSALKGRVQGKPFLLLVSSREMLARVGLRITEAGERLAAAFWPGPLTLVVPGGERLLPDTLRGPEGGIAVRWTSHPGACRIVSVLGSPITSTSANRPREEPAADGLEVEAAFPGDVAAGTLLVLDAGRLVTSAPSTVIDCTGAVPRLVREGAVRLGALRSILPALAGDA